MHRIYLAVLVALFCSSQSRGADWPQWRGPNRDDVSKETGLLKSWPDDGPPQDWLYRQCGLGYGGPAIVDGRLYIMGSRGSVEQLIALDVEDANELWHTPLGEELKNDWGNGPRGTPTVDGDRVYVLAARGKLSCINIDDGDVVWSKEMQELGGKIPAWGYSESVLIHDGKVICTPGGENGAVAALDKQTGELLWQTKEITTNAHYSSPVIADRDGEIEVVQLLEKQLIGVDFKTGEVNWEVPWPGRVAVIPTPIVRDSLVYATSGYGVGSTLVEIGPDHEVEKRYDNKVMKNHHGGVILLGDHVYGHSDGPGWVCQDFKTGKQVWRERDALGKGAIAYADGRFYCLDESSGEIAIIAATPDGWEEHGRFTLNPQTELRKDRGKIWTHPVISNGRLYLRDQELLFSFDVSEAAARTASTR